MIGYLVWQGKGWRIRYFEETILGVSVWRAELPVTEDPRRQQRLRMRATETLRRHGITRLFHPESASLPTIATGPLWRALACPTALAALRQQHLPPAQAFVALRAKQPDRTVVACCAALAPVVRGLALEMPHCEELTWQLQRRFGLPILAQGGDLTLNFAAAAPGLDLHGDRPHPTGLTLTCPGLEMPSDCPQEELLAYLVEQGALSWRKLRVVSRPMPPLVRGRNSCYNRLHSIDFTR